MANRLSQGTLQITSLDIASVNYMLQQIRKELDEIQGLRGIATVHGTLNVQDLTGVDTTGTGAFVKQVSPTLTTPTLTIPVIADFTSAPHTHQDAPGGGTLDHNLATDNPSAATHGVTGNVVGDSDTQSLTNKTQGVVGNSAFARVLVASPHTAAPAGTLAVGEWDVAVYDNGVTPVVRVRYNDGGVEKTFDGALV